MRTKREQEQRLAQWFMAESGRKWDTADEFDVFKYVVAKKRRGRRQ